jgi:hypothetical protein
MYMGAEDSQPADAQYFQEQLTALNVQLESLASQLQTVQATVNRLRLTPPPRRSSFGRRPNSASANLQLSAEVKEWPTPLLPEKCGGIETPETTGDGHVEWSDEGDRSMNGNIDEQTPNSESVNELRRRLFSRTTQNDSEKAKRSESAGREPR